MSSRPSVGAIWNKKSRDGKVYMSGYIQVDPKSIVQDEKGRDIISFICFPNNFQQDGSPSFNMLISEKRRNDGHFKVQ